MDEKELDRYYQSRKFFEALEEQERLDERYKNAHAWYWVVVAGFFVLPFIWIVLTAK